MDNFGEKLLILTVLTAGLAGAYWYFLVYVPPQADGPIVLQPEAVEEPPEETGPIHPMVPPNSSAPTERTLVPLPALDDSDGYFLLALVDIFGPDVRPVMVSEALIDKFVATVDSLPRNHVAEKIRPVGRLPDRFLVDAVGDDGEYLLRTDNFSRYDSLVYLLETADLEFSGLATPTVTSMIAPWKSLITCWRRRNRTGQFVSSGHMYSMSLPTRILQHCRAARSSCFEWDAITRRRSSGYYPTCGH